MTCSVVGPRRSSKALPRARLAPKEASWSLFGVLLLVWSTITFWFPAKPSHLRIMLSKISEMPWKLQGFQLILFYRMDPVLLHDDAWTQVAQPTLQKLNKLGYKVLLHLLYSPDLLPTSYHFFKHLNNFLQGKHFCSQQKAENAFQELVKSWSVDFYTTGISKLISHWQKCIDYNGSCFD